MMSSIEGFLKVSSAGAESMVTGPATSLHLSVSVLRSKWARKLSYDRAEGM